MQAILLSTETTSRLGPLSKHSLVPLLPLANRPLMVYIIELLAQAGIHQIHVGLPHLSGSAQAYFGEGQRWNVHLNYVTQEGPEDTASLLKRVVDADKQPGRTHPGSARRPNSRFGHPRSTGRAQSTRRARHGDLWNASCRFRRDVQGWLLAPANGRFSP